MYERVRACKCERASERGVVRHASCVVRRACARVLVRACEVGVHGRVQGGRVAGGIVCVGGRGLQWAGGVACARMCACVRAVRGVWVEVNQREPCGEPM